MRKLAYAILVGLVGAGIVHIVVLFLLPTLTQRDAWTRLANASGLYVVIPVDGLDKSQPVVNAPDPLFRAVACRFNLEDGPVRLKAEGKVPFWSASVYDRSGQNIYSFTDRTATDGMLDFVVATPTEMIDMRKDLPAELASAVFVEADVGEGIVVIRSFAPDDSWNSIISTYLKSITCQTQ